MELHSAVRRELAALWDNGTGVSLVAVAAGWGLLNGVRMILPVVIPYLESAYGLSLSVAGLLVTVLWFFAAIGQLPGGILADKYSERTLMTLATFIVAAALGLVITAPSPLVLFFATAIWGLGHSMYPIARITFLSKRYPERLGSALGVTMATGDVGQTALPPVATVIAGAIAWQMGLGFVIPLLVLAGAAILLVSPNEKPEARRSDTQSLRDTLDVVRELRTPSLGFMSVILFLYMFIWQSFTAFYPTYLTSIKEIDPSTASVLFGFFFAVGVVVKPLAGTAYDRIGMRKSLVGILTPAVAGFFVLPMVSNVWLLVAVTALVSVMLGTGAITQSFLADSFSDEMQGTGLGVVRTITAALAAGGPVVFGVIGENGYFDEGYLLLAVIMTAVIGLVLRMPEERSS